MARDSDEIKDVKYSTDKYGRPLCDIVDGEGRIARSDNAGFWTDYRKGHATKQDALSDATKRLRKMQGE